VGRPDRREVRTPEVDGVEAVLRDVREQLVEALRVCLERGEGLVRQPVTVTPAVHRVARLACDVVGRHEGDRVRHRESTWPWSSSDRCSAPTSTSCTATPRRAAWAAARPAACPSSISVGSIRTEPNATCDAEMQTGTIRSVQSCRRGTSERYGIGYGGTGTER